MTLTINDIEQQEFRDKVERLHKQVVGLTNALRRAGMAFRKASASFARMRKIVEQ